MLNPTFASFKNSNLPKKNNENRERSKELYCKKPQPKTFQELKNASEANKNYHPHAKYSQIPLHQAPTNQFTPNPNGTYMKKSYSQLNIGGVGRSFQGSGVKVKP